MCLQICNVCQHLVDNVSVISTRRLGAKMLLEDTVKNNPDDRDILSLRRLENSLLLECREAVDQYRIHLLRHETSAAVADLAA